MKRLFQSLLILLTLAMAAPAHAAADALTQNRIRQAMRTIEPLREFGELYTNGFYFLKKEHGRTVIEVRTLLTPYYELVMRVPVNDAHGDQRVIATGAPEVELWRLQKIDFDLGGKLQVDREFPQTLINAGQWSKLVQADGDFSAIGLKLEPGLRLYNLDKYRDKLREEADVGW